MRRLSRSMPPMPEHPLTWRAVVFLSSCLGLFAALLLATAYRFPAVLLGSGGLALFYMLLAVLLNFLDDRRLRRLSAHRPGESICTFARAFDCRQVDPWIIRAVYEEFQLYCTFRGGVLPLRASDRLKEELHIDGDDLDFDHIETIAYRTGRSLEQVEANPLFGKVQTVGELILFFNHQPRTSAT